MSQKHMPMPSRDWALKTQDEAPKHLKLLWDLRLPASLPTACSQALFRLPLDK